jgi:hypothetical protein
MWYTFFNDNEIVFDSVEMIKTHIKYYSRDKLKYQILYNCDLNRNGFIFIKKNNDSKINN